MGHDIHKYSELQVLWLASHTADTRSRHLHLRYADCSIHLPHGLIRIRVPAIMTLQPTSQPRTKAAGLARHQLAILALAVPIMVFGYTAIFVTKNMTRRRHFTTWHGVSAGMIVALARAHIF